MKPAGIIPTRIGYTRRAYVSRPTPNKPPKQATPVCDAIREHKLPDPAVLVGNGPTATTPDPRGMWSMWSFLAWSAVCAILAGCLLAAGHELFQQMRGM